MPDETPKDVDWQKVRDFLEPKPPLYSPHEPHPKQKAFLRTDALEVLFGGAASGGKLVDTSTIVLSTDGWTTIGDLKVGDFVFDENGESTEVLAKSEILSERTYRLRFQGGEEIVAGERHRWNVANENQRSRYQRTDPHWKAARRAKRAPRGKTEEERLEATDGRAKGTAEAAALNNSKRAQEAREAYVHPSIWDYTSVLTTEEVIELQESERKRVSIPNGGPLNGPGEWKSAIPPYTLGVWLGDGGAKDGYVYTAEEYKKELERELLLDGWTTEVASLQTPEDHPARKQNFYGLRLTNGQGETLRDLLHGEDLYGNKHIPDWIFLASHDDKKSFLSGFFDTDGYIDAERGRLEMCLSTEDICRQLWSLFWSMGMKPSSVQFKKTKNQDPEFEGKAWRFQVSQCPECLFRVPFKRDRWLACDLESKMNRSEYRAIESIEEIDPVPMQCIQVANPRGLFRIGRSFIVTHNSDALLMAALQYPLDVDTPVPTPEGWSTIGKLEVGDMVFDQNGVPVPVLAKTQPEWSSDLYEMYFNEGYSIVADGKHLWAAETLADRMSPDGGEHLPTRTVSTAEMFRTQRTSRGRKPAAQWSILDSKPLDLPEIELPVDPYLLGVWLVVWLGDRSWGDGGAVGIDREVEEALRGVGYEIARDGEHHWHDLGLRTNLKRAGVLIDKHVPQAYFRASKGQRLALLQGLMDADGTTDAHWGTPIFFSTNRLLVEAVVELVSSFGWHATRSKQWHTTPSGEQKFGWLVSFPADEYVFRLTRKKAKQKQSVERKRTNTRMQKRWIVSKVERLNESRLVQCLTVGSEDHLFLVGENMVPTHNCDVPGYAAIIFRNTFADLALPGAIMDRAREWLSEYPEVRWLKQSNTAVFPSGATLSFGYLDGPDDHLRYKGMEVQYCVEKSTPVLMADGSWRPIEDIEVGDEVQTLQGARKVTRTHSPGMKPAWKVTTPNGSSVVVGEGHRMLSTDGCWVAPTSLAAKTNLESGTTSSGFQATLQVHGKHEIGSCRDQGPSPAASIATQGAAVHQGCVVSEASDRTYFSTSEDALLTSQRLLVSFAPLALYGPALHSGQPSHTPPPSRTQDSAPWRESEASQGRDCLDGCPSCPGFDGGQFLPARADDRGLPPSRGDAGQPDQFCCNEGGRGSIPLCIPMGGISYVHPYTSEICTSSLQDVYSAVCEMAPVGEVDTRDLTVDSCSHYIIKGGIVSANCGFDELTEIRENHYRYLISRIRRPSAASGSPLAKVPLRARSATNPAPNWVRRYFIEEGKHKDSKRLFIPCGFEENPYVDIESYGEALDRLSSVDRARLKFGDWYAEETGNLFDRDDFPIIAPEDVPAEAFMNCVRYWDLAGSAPSDSNPDPDWTAGAKVAIVDGYMFILDMRRFRAGPADVERRVLQTAWEDGNHVKIRMEKDPGQAGLSQISHYARNVLLGFDFDGNSITADKGKRVNNWAAKAKRKEIFLVRGDWVTAFLDEVMAFDPLASKKSSIHDDQCFGAGTLVRTDRGYVEIQDVSVGDMVWTRFGFKEVLETFEREAPTVKLRVGGNEALVVTPNHPLLTFAKKREYRKHAERPRLQRYWEEVGWETVQEMVESGEQRGLCNSWPSRTESGAATTDLREFTPSSLKNRVGVGKNKSIPSEWFNWGDNLLRQLVLEIFLEDGHIDERGDLGMSLANRQLIYQVREILFHLGYNPTLGRVEYQGRPQWTVRISRSQAVDLVEELSSRWPSKPLHPRVEFEARGQEDGKRVEAGVVWPVISVEAAPTQTVYNLRVADVNEYTANGLVVHNCDAISGAFEVLTGIKGKQRKRVELIL